jgi:hypothetical protein
MIAAFDTAATLALDYPTPPKTPIPTTTKQLDPPRRFALVNAQYDTPVAHGVKWSDGTVTVRWTNEPRSTVMWNNIDDVEAISIVGHDRRIEWMDPLPTKEYPNTCNCVVCDANREED